MINGRVYADNKESVVWIFTEEFREKLKHNIIEGVFPRRCPVCGEVVDEPDRKICPDCQPELHMLQEPVCKVCGRELHDELAERCNCCQRHRFSFEYGMVLMEYNRAAAVSMAAVKYGGAKEYLDYYAEEVVKRYGKQIKRLNIDAIVPVPVHKERLKKRGYNQAEVLADHLGAELGIPVCRDALKRKRKTEASKELGAAERLKNLGKAFCEGEVPDGLYTALLVDDIFTTGATMEACTRVLRSAGVGKVYVLSLCAASDI